MYGFPTEVVTTLHDTPTATPSFFEVVTTIHDTPTATPSSFRFQDKTVNNWEERKTFVKHQGKYDLLLIDYDVKVINVPSLRS